MSALKAKELKVDGCNPEDESRLLLPETSAGL